MYLIELDRKVILIIIPKFRRLITIFEIFFFDNLIVAIGEKILI